MTNIRRLALYGSTGSIGTQTLEVIEATGAYKIALLTARANWELLVRQALRWKPELVIVGVERCYRPLKDALSGTGIKVEVGENALVRASSELDFDLALNALVGISGLSSSVIIVKRGINLALANKESLVLAGSMLTSAQKASGAKILPVDSEHSAIFQCLWGEKRERVRRLILTASGGPFRKFSRAEMESVTPRSALNHPNWVMGAKVTIDSATLMNKGLEVIEAYHLFGLPLEKIDVRVHPVSIVHSLVQFVDGSFKAQLGRPDMRLPIQIALSWPDRLELPFLESDDPVSWPPLTFEQVRSERFPCLGLAYRALQIGGTATAVLNGADEAAVTRFLDGGIAFLDIPRIIESALDQHHPKSNPTIEDIISADTEGRVIANEFVSEAATKGT